MACFGFTLVANIKLQPPQEIIRYVDIDKALEGWTGYQLVRERLGAETQRLRSGLELQAQELQSMASELELLDSESQAYFELKLQINVAEETLQFQQNMALNQMQERANTAFLSALTAVNEAVSKIGESSGYSAILFVPRSLNNPGMDQSAVLTELTNRQVAFVNPAHDVTQQVIDVLNQLNTPSSSNAQATDD